MLQNRRISPNSPLASLLKRAHLLLLIVIGALAVAVPMSAQSFTAAGTKTGTILGTVVDTTDDPIPAANVILQGPAGDRSHGCHQRRRRLRLQPSPGRSRLSDHRHC